MNKISTITVDYSANKLGYWIFLATRRYELLGIDSSSNSDPCFAAVHCNVHGRSIRYICLLCVCLVIASAVASYIFYDINLSFMRRI